jgi:3-oxoacyl-[acyl-carrier protein] reductase
MLLDRKTAIVYGAAGAIGFAVARAYAREGAEVHLAGRTEESLNKVAERIHQDGGAVKVATLDVLDRAAVEQHADAVSTASGGIDICFNATSNDDLQGTPLVDMQFADFLQPVTKAVTAHFNIATAAGRHMTSRGRGVILVMAGGREAIPRLAARTLPGPRSPVSAANSPPNSDQMASGSTGCYDDQHTATSPLEDDAAHAPGTAGLLPHHQPSYDEVAHIAAFAASD